MIKRAATHPARRTTQNHKTKTATSIKKPSNTSYNYSDSGFNYTATSTAGKDYAPTPKEKIYEYNLNLEDPNSAREHIQEPIVKKGYAPADMRVIRGDLYKDNPKKIDYATSKVNAEFAEKAIINGIYNLIGENPELSNVQEYLIKHIDQQELHTKFNQEFLKAKKRGMSPDKATYHAYSKLEEYISEGHLLDDRAKKTLFRGKLEKKVAEEEKGFWYNLTHHRQLKRKEYLNKAKNAFDDLNALLKTGDYAEIMPEVTKAVTTLYDLNFLEPATDVLREYGLIKSREYKSIKNDMYNLAKQESKNFVSGIEKYIVPQKIAASIIGLVGLVFVLLNLNITGAVIGGDSQITMGIAGIFMIFFALLIYLRPLKKSFKK